jgi:hypothetical protein
VVCACACACLCLWVRARARAAGVELKWGMSEQTGQLVEYQATTMLGHLAVVVFYRGSANFGFRGLVTCCR